MPFKDFAAEIARNCLCSISRASIVFAWLAYGSFAEIGFAHSLGKPVWLAWPKPLPELWFIQQMATVSIIAQDASLAFRELLFSQLGRSLW
jgi:nucleoside 2-deoxyribosyltransferase